MDRPIEEQLLGLFRLTKQRIQAIAERNSLTYPQLVALRHLARDGQLTMSDLTTRLGTTRGALTGLIDRLEEAGFVARRPCAEDRRVIFLSLTPQGQEVLRGMEADWRQEIHRWLSRLGEQDQKTLSASLALLLDAGSANEPQ